MSYKELFINKDNVLIVNTELAVVLGSVNEAIVINQLHYWLESNKKQGRNFKGGKYWIYNSYKDWIERDFPFWSEYTLKRIITSLETKKLVISANYNQMKVDKTKWYTIDYDTLDELVKNHRKSSISSERAISHDGHKQNARPIQETNINTLSNDKDINTFFGKKGSRFISEDYSLGELKEHIKKPIREELEDCGIFDNGEKESQIIDLIVMFYEKWYECFGFRHRVLSDKAYQNIVDRFLNEPDIMNGTEPTICYPLMMDKYMITDFGKNSGKEINKSLSHFMCDEIRDKLFYQTCYGICY